MTAYGSCVGTTRGSTTTGCAIVTSAVRSSRTLAAFLPIRRGRAVHRTRIISFSSSRSSTDRRRSCRGAGRAGRATTRRSVGSTYQFRTGGASCVPRVTSVRSGRVVRRLPAGRHTAATRAAVANRPSRPHRADSVARVLPDERPQKPARGIAGICDRLSFLSRPGRRGAG